MNPKIDDSLSGRIDTMSNLRRQIVESGGSMNLSYLVQSLQCLIHYETLGCSVSPLFKNYSETLMSCKHHALGYFPIESIRTCGLLGTQYAFYNLLKNNESTRKAESYLMNSSKIAMTKFGPSVKISFKIGEQGSYKKFRERIKKLTGDDIKVHRKAINENPRCLYMGVESKDEMMALLSIKATDPAAALGFTYETSCKVYRTSEYLLSTGCVGKMRKEEDGTIEYTKYSLLRMLSDTIRGMEDTKRTFSMDLMAAASLYKEADLIKDTSDCTMSMINEPKRSVMHTNFSKTFAPGYLDFMDVCKSVWFDHQIRSNKNEIRRSWSFYKNQFSWLKKLHR